MLNLQNYKRVDIFGADISLRFQNRKQYKSYFGAITTTIIVIFISFQILIVGRELISKENPEVIQSESYVELPSRFDIKPDTFNFAFGIENPNDYVHFIDESIYTVEVEQQILQSVYNETTKGYDQAWISYLIPTHSCTNQDPQLKETQNYFTHLQGYQKMYCIDHDQIDKDVYLEGAFDKEKFAQISINFKACNNKTSNVTCKENVEELLTNSVVALYMSDVIVNPKDYYPFQAVGKNNAWRASPLIAKELTMFFRDVYVESDKGIFFEDKKFEKTTVYSYTDQNIVFGENKFFFSLNLRKELLKKSVYNRKYKKIDGAFAQIGGIAKALMIVGYILLKPINEIYLNQNLANSLFKFSIQDSSLNKEHKQKDDRNQETKKQAKAIIDNHKQSVQTQNQEINHIYNYKKEEKMKINGKHQYDKNNYVFSQNYNSKLKENDKAKHSQQIQLNHIQNNNSAHQKQNENENLFNSHPLSPTGVSTSLNRRSTLKIVDMIRTKKQTIQNEQNTSQAFSPLSKLSLQQTNQNKKYIAQQLNKDDQNIQKKFREENEEQSELALSWSEYLQILIWPWGKTAKKKKLLNYSTERIYYHLDMVYIVQKLLELEKLKQLLLDEDQIKLIQFFPKPLISEEEIQRNTSNKKDYKKRKDINLLNDGLLLSDQERAKQAFQSLRNIMQKPIITETDQKIIEMLDYSILENIQNNPEFLKELDEAVKFQEEIKDDRVDDIFEQNGKLRTPDRSPSFLINSNDDLEMNQYKLESNQFKHNSSHKEFKEEVYGIQSSIGVQIPDFQQLYLNQKQNSILSKSIISQNRQRQLTGMENNQSQHKLIEPKLIS